MIFSPVTLVSCGPEGLHPFLRLHPLYETCRCTHPVQAHVRGGRGRTLEQEVRTEACAR